ncbi:hypothetical protein [Microbacterium sp. TPD7012]|uniref:hypothetical protein n=1 Tax=Microbacterium sp. TPD7012 TaxID=2171975 RepID=UPI001402727E|nr:hypothetical protein [Microbacterium sp. TPD7012]
MDSPSSRRRDGRTAAPLTALALALLALPACTASSTPDAAPTSASDDHGIPAGAAAEVASPARALIVADAEGEVVMLDLDSEERSVISPAASDVERIDADGRLVFVTHRDGDRVRVDVIDTARWTVPHGDHTHSFLGEPQLRGSVDGTGEVRVTAGAQRATVHFSSGEVVELPHDDLAEVLDDAPRVTIAADGPVVSFASHLLAATAEGTVAVFDADGAPVAGGAIPCAAAADADLTRVGVVFACTEGAVLFTREVGGTIAAEPLPLPAGAAAATDLSGRADRPDLAGVAGDQGAWLLDVRTRQWTLLSSDVPLLRAVAVGDDDSRTVALDAEGRVRVLAADGTVLVRTEPLLATSVADPALLAPVQLVVDAEHAYLSDPAAGAVHEIDHTDGIVTRTFADLDPRFLSQVG